MLEFLNNDVVLSLKNVIDLLNLVSVGFNIYFLYKLVYIRDIIFSDGP